VAGASYGWPFRVAIFIDMVVVNPPGPCGPLPT
jgi:hypothetical protein